MKKNNIYKILSFKNIILVLLKIYTIFIFTPYFSDNLQLVFIFNFLLFLSIILYNFKKSTLISKESYILFIWFFYIIFLKIIDFSSGTWGNYFYYFMFISPLFLFNDFFNNLTLTDKRNFLIFSTLVVIINLFINLYFIFKFPGIVNQINFSNENLVLKYNLGTTVYSLLWLLVGYCIFWYFLFIKKNIFSFILLISFYLYPIVSGKTTAFLILIFISIILLFLRFFRKFSQPSQLLLLVFFSIILTILFPFSIRILNSIIDSQYINSRLNALINFDFDSIYLNRWQLGIISLNTFLDNPIFGIGFLRIDFSSDFSLIYSSGIGHHSEILDHLARYGLIGLLFYIYIFGGFFRKLFKNNYSKKTFSLIFPMVIAFLSFSVLNNSFTTFIGLYIFFLLPIIQEVFYFEVIKNEKI